MKCEIAKNNFVLIDKAIAYYLRGNKMPYTFMSLWNDNEPYPLHELKKALKRRIMITINKQKTEPSLANEMLIERLNKQLTKLEKIK